MDKRTETLVTVLTDCTLVFASQISVFTVSMLSVFLWFTLSATQKQWPYKKWCNWEPDTPSCFSAVLNLQHWTWLVLQQAEPVFIPAGKEAWPHQKQQTHSTSWTWPQGHLRAAKQAWQSRNPKPAVFMLMGMPMRSPLPDSSQSPLTTVVPQLTSRLVPSYFGHFADSPKPENKACSVKQGKGGISSWGLVPWTLGRFCTTSAAKWPEVISAAYLKLDGMSPDLREVQSSLLSIPSKGGIAKKYGLSSQGCHGITLFLT